MVQQECVSYHMAVSAPCSCFQILKEWKEAQTQHVAHRCPRNWVAKIYFSAEGALHGIHCLPTAPSLHQVDPGAHGTLVCFSWEAGVAGCRGWQRSRGDLARTRAWWFWAQGTFPCWGFCALRNDTREKWGPVLFRTLRKRIAEPPNRNNKKGNSF